MLARKEFGNWYFIKIPIIFKISKNTGITGEIEVVFKIYKSKHLGKCWHALINVKVM